VNEDPYPQIQTWQVGGAALAATWEALRAGEGRETAVLWLGGRAPHSAVTTVIRLRGEGVEEGTGHFEAVPEVLGVVTRWAKPRGLTLLANLHAHPPGVPGTMSTWDRRHGFAVPEFLAVIAGDGARDHPDAWGWYVFSRSARDYRDMDDGERRSRVVVDGTAGATLLEADARAVRPWL
jgi:hypothetical protein